VHTAVESFPIMATPCSPLVGIETVVELMRSSKAADVALDHGDVHRTLPGRLRVRPQW
jgi:hypothetical protein